MMKNAIYIDVQVITNEIPLRVEREIWVYSSDEDRMNKPQQSITRSEILAITDAYETIEWTCSAENTTNHQLIQLPDESYIRTPVWVVVGDLRRVPYKWGGFTHVDNFNNRIFNGAYAGDDYCVRSDAFAVSYGDTYCVGVDCSGFVSRIRTIPIPLIRRQSSHFIYPNPPQ